MFIYCTGLIHIRFLLCYSGETDPMSLNDSTVGEIMGKTKVSIFHRVLSALFVVAVIITGAATYTLTAGTKTVSAAPTATVSVSSATISGSNVIVKVSASSVPQSDDGQYYLYAQNCNQVSAGGTPLLEANQGTLVGKATASTYAQFTFPLNKNSASSNLYKKFCVAVKQGGVLYSVTIAEKYISNPEACATKAAARYCAGKKGILPSAAMLDTNDLQNLGIKQITYNVPVETLCSGSGVSYQYNGKIYNFNASIVAQYDKIVPLMNSRGIEVTLIILNNRSNDLSLLHPLSRNYSGANYYAFNTYDTDGVERLEAIAAFLASRYSGNGHGTVDNWIIGNEINAYSSWHYMNADFGTFVSEYAKSFRIFYNAIKSENSNARVYTCTDQQWNTCYSGGNYSSVNFLSGFNNVIKGSGNIDWRLAYHPYNYPMADGSAWVCNASIVQHSITTPFITMMNMDVVTDFLCQSDFLSPTGAVRTVLLSEQGYTSLGGEQAQAASVVYAYLQAVTNKYVDGFILSREQDDSSEIAMGLAVGLVNVNGSHKLAYEYYKHIDAADSATYIAQANAIAGVDLQSLITVR